MATRPHRKHGTGGTAWNKEPRRVRTSIGRKCPSVGASEPPASIEIAIRLAETVRGSGQFIGPATASGASE